jgi:DNA-binding transcriptional regulator YiaG
MQFPKEVDIAVQMELSSIWRPMRTLQHAKFVALLASADVSQASFARLSGVSTRQVNKWCRGRAALPRWAAETLTIMREELPRINRGQELPHCSEDQPAD